MFRDIKGQLEIKLFYQNGENSFFSEGKPNPDTSDVLLDAIIAMTPHHMHHGHVCDK